MNGPLMDYRRSWRTVIGNKRWRRVRVWMARCSFLAVVLLLACCRYWGWRRLEQPTPLDPHDEVRIWRGDTMWRWHAVVITADSVSGIPLSQPLKCDDCRE